MIHRSENDLPSNRSKPNRRSVRQLLAIRLRPANPDPAASRASRSIRFPPLRLRIHGLRLLTHCLELAVVSRPNNLERHQRFLAIHFRNRLLAGTAQKLTQRFRHESQRIKSTDRNCHLQRRVLRLCKPVASVPSLVIANMKACSHRR